MRWDIPLCCSVWLNDRWDGNAPEREYSTSYRVVPSLRRLSPSPAPLLPRDDSLVGGSYLISKTIISLLEK
jgi:hypothetical protein